MTDPLHISATEHGVVRLFRVEAEADDLPALLTPSLPGETADHGTPIQAALGAKVLDVSKVEAFDVARLGDMGLPNYLTEGLGIPAEAMRADQAMLQTVTGCIAVVPSSAFKGVAQHLTPRAPLSLLGRYEEERPNMIFAAIPTDSARGGVGDTPSAPTPPMGRALTLTLAALAVVMGLGLLLWALL